ncbi:guanylate kinase [Parasaccharibacter sp. TMW2.1882]|uniref:Guanylate kinase n=2 Tax=Acetobacteraceae TaxID=433 RepID=A0A7U7J0N3_9PROT|nr:MULTISPECIES: guanylate kinase [Acetobacteraceae]MCL1563339.1 guanylate kinase [Parasaccharibacter sp. TMW 2.1886]MUG80179.1 guanylate kinase [Bombella sp. ESL0380]MUH03530.1 guanylate kinase [Bombella sp. ESL0387]QGT75738.1 guanylate kinase [Bombella sp. ESL0368]MBE1724407.1 guanylate kinase [Bombella apis]
MVEQSRRGVCLVISAPSGAGKSTIAQALRKADPTIFTSVSVTTRSPRPGEEEGVHYYFRDLETFRHMAANGELLEWAEVFGRGYGTPRAPLEEALAAGRDVILDIDWQGCRLMRRAMPDDVVGLFVLPPSLEELESRLRGRNSDSEEEIASRMKAAMSEISHWPEFDYVLVNDDLDRAVEEARAVLSASRLARARRRDVAALWPVAG